MPSSPLEVPPRQHVLVACPQGLLESLKRAEVIAEEHDPADRKRRCGAEFNAGVVAPEAIATGKESLPRQSAGERSHAVRVGLPTESPLGFELDDFVPEGFDFWRCGFCVHR